MSSDGQTTRRSLGLADPKTESIRTLPPLSESFPRSAKISRGDLEVPVRRIELEGGEPPLEVYDTTGPQGHDPRAGIPERRAELPHLSTAWKTITQAELASIVSAPAFDGALFRGSLGMENGAGVRSAGIEGADEDIGVVAQCEQ